MTALLDALKRLDVVAPARSEPAAKTESKPAAPSVASATAEDLPEPPRIDADEFADALARLQPPSAILALVACDADADLSTMLPGLADSVSQRLGCEAVSLGPGVLDSAASVERFAELMRLRMAYGFLHATADFAAARPAGLRATDGVVAVVKLGRTPTRALISLRETLARNGVKLLGSLAVTPE